MIPRNRSTSIIVALLSIALVLAVLSTVYLFTHNEYKFGLVMAFMIIAFFGIIMFILLNLGPRPRTRMVGSMGILYSAYRHGLLDEVLHEFGKDPGNSITSVEHKIYDAYLEWMK